MGHAYAWKIDEPLLSESTTPRASGSIQAVKTHERRRSNGANLPISLQVLKTNGVIATYSSDADPTPTIPFGQFLGKDITVRFVLVYVMGEAAHQDAINDITTALEAGLLHPVAVQRFSLDEIAAAHEAVETGHTAGKVLIDLNSDL